MLTRGDTDLLEEMRLDRLDDTKWSGRLTDRFNAPVQPQGGITSALALHAAELTLDRTDQRLRSCTTVFAGQVLPGPVEVEVEVVREGKSASQLQATVRPVDGDPAGHRVLATFARDLESPIALGPADVPDAPPPGQCRDRWNEEAPQHADQVGPKPSFFEHFEQRMVIGHTPWDPPWDTDPGEVITWMRWLDTPRDDDGGISPLGLVAVCDTMPGAVFERHGRDDRWFLVPSVDLTVQIFDTELADDGWLLRRNRSRWAGHGLAAADMEIFSADGRCLAYATQLMHIRVADVEALRQRIENGG